jgi:hypothetical protein
MNKTVLHIVFIVCCQPVFAQFVDTLGVTPSLNQRELQLVYQQWLYTDNAAGLAFSNVNKGGFTTFERYQSKGNHHRVQEGSANTWILFSSEGYSRFSDKLFARGKFSFLKNDETDRAWSDVVYTYNANPFIFGSSVRGNYDKQQFDMNLQVYSALVGKVTLGISMNYLVADISRQRDPRSRTYFIDYAVIPSVTYSLSGKSKLGLNAFYRYDKERTPNLSTVQTDPNLQYYTFTGLQNALGRIGGYRAFQRQFISDYTGGAIQYQYNDQGTKLLVSLGMDMQWQQTLGDKRQSPGSFNAYYINALANLILRKEKHLHNILFAARFKDGGADEYRQTLFAERDSVTGVSTEFWKTDYVYVNRFIVTTSDVSLSYKSYRLKSNQKEYDRSIGAELGYQSFSNRYFLPESNYAVERFFAGIHGSLFLYDNHGHSLVLSSLVKAGVPVNTELHLSHETDVSEFVLKPDMDFHRRNSLELSGSIKYSFPMKFVSNSSMSGYARLFGGNQFAENSHNWFSFSLAIGLLTF